MKVIVTGGNGFIGSDVCRRLVLNDDDVLNIDALKYSGTKGSVETISNNNNYIFAKGDICDYELMRTYIIEYAPDAIIHLAAETHVDRSISDPLSFVKTNVLGTSTLLEVAREYYEKIKGKKKFRFHHVSTDEVYGSLDKNGLFFEDTLYDPSSPYSASKASSDHLVMSYYKTYGLPVTISNTCNNYGLFQFPEKLIPLTIINALEGNPIPIYGNGEQIRDWIHVSDHTYGIFRILKKGEDGRKYNIGNNCELTNLQVVDIICEELANMRKEPIDKYKSLKEYVEDRPGHDFRYGISPIRMKYELNWSGSISFRNGISNTIHWYMSNEGWWRPLFENKRLGLLK